MRAARSLPYLVLLQVGFALPRLLPAARCALAAPFHPYLPCLITGRAGGIFSVALSMGSRPPGVTWHLALWSPDFPPCLRRATAWPTPGMKYRTFAQPPHGRNHRDHGLRAPRNSLPSRRLSGLSRRRPGIMLVFLRKPSSPLRRSRPRCAGSVIRPRRNAAQALSR
jgi:hypothetical protein